MEAERDSREFQILLWGVTGWTGVHLLEYFVKTYPLENGYDDAPVRWAVVARSEAKLAKAIEQVSEEYKAPWLNDVKSFLVDNSDEEKIAEVVKQSMSVATVVGPYMKYGEKLLKACAELGTHYCDITGELVYVRNMMDKYAKIAEENGTFIVPCCGFDSVPSDLGSFFAVQNLNKHIMLKYNLNEEQIKSAPKKIKVRSFVTSATLYNRSEGHSPGGGTVASLLDIMKEKDFKESQKSYYLTGDDDDCKEDASHRPQMGFSRNSKIGSLKWSTHFLMSVVNEKVVRRSRYLMPEIYGNKFSYHEALAVGNPFTAMLLSSAFGVGYGLLSIPFFYRMIKKRAPPTSQFPPPRPENYKPGQFEMVFLAEGKYDLSQFASDDNPKSQKSLKAVKVDGKTKITHPDEMAWTETGKMLGESALSLVLSLETVRAQNGKQGGFITPACIGNTLLERLTQNEAKYEVLLPKPDVSL